MSYPSLYGHMYEESANEWDSGMKFVTNDLLLCIMLFCRFPFFF